MKQPALDKAGAVLATLRQMPEDLVSLGSPSDEDRFQLFGNSIGFELPADFVYILSRHNSFDSGGNEVYGLDSSFGEQSLDKCYQFEHSDAGNPMPPHYLPFSPDGFGNHYCLDLSRMANGTCPVVFWQHDVEYETPDDVETCNNSFADWVLKDEEEDTD